MPPSDEGGGFAVGEDGGRENGSLPKKKYLLHSASLTLIRGSQVDAILHDEHIIGWLQEKIWCKSMKNHTLGLTYKSEYGNISMKKPTFLYLGW